MKIASQVIMKTRSFAASYLVCVSLEPMTQWTIKASYLDVSFPQYKCERSCETDGYDCKHRQQEKACCPSAEEPLKLFKHF